VIHILARIVQPNVNPLLICVFFFFGAHLLASAGLIN